VFRPSLAGTLAAVVLVPLLLSLGIWQLHRAQEKRVLLARYAEAQATAPLALSRVQGDPLPFMPVRVLGQWDASHSILLDNRTRDGIPGVWVYRLLRVPLPHYDAVLVNRGWLPVDLRTRRPRSIPAAAGETVVTGFLTQPPRPGMRLGSAPKSPVGDQELVTEIDLASLEHHWRLRLWPGTIRQSDPHPLFIRRWEPNLMPPSRHTGYAVQWFAMALTVLALYLATAVHRARSGIEA